MWKEYENAYATRSRQGNSLLQQKTAPALHHGSQPASSSHIASTSNYTQHGARQGGTSATASGFDPLTSLYNPTKSWATQSQEPPSAVPSINTSATSDYNANQAPLSSSHWQQRERHQQDQQRTSLSQAMPPVFPAPSTASSSSDLPPTASFDAIRTATVGVSSGTNAHLVTSRVMSSSTLSGTAPYAHSSQEDVESRIPEAVRSRLESLTTVNLTLKMELDRVKHQFSMQQVDMSRLHDQIQMHIAQETFLKSQLEQVLARQQQLLQFETTAEGCGRQDMLEHQNKELRMLVEAKERELQTMQKRMQDAIRREQAAVDEVQKQQHRLLQLETVNRGAAPSAVSDTSARPAHAERDNAQARQRLCAAMDSVHFLHQFLLSLRHVVLTPHDNGTRRHDVFSSLLQFQRQGEGVAFCPRSRRQCGMQCLESAARGSEHDATTQQVRQENRPLETLFSELVDIITQTEGIVSSSCSRLVACIHEEEAALLGSAEDLPTDEHDHQGPFGASRESLIREDLVASRGVSQQAIPTSRSPSTQAPVPNRDHEGTPRTNSNGASDVLQQQQQSHGSVDAPTTTTYAFSSLGGVKKQLRVMRSPTQSMDPTTTTTNNAPPASGPSPPPTVPPRRHSGKPTGGGSNGNDYGGCQQQ